MVIDTTGQSRRWLLLVAAAADGRSSGLPGSGVELSEFFPPMLSHLRATVGTADDMEKFMKAFKEIFPQKAQG
ncbi:MAG: hypothetical protein AB7P34_11460 [Vicinamibacterales bacterium]